MDPANLSPRSKGWLCHYLYSGQRQQDKEFRITFGSGFQVDLTAQFFCRRFGDIQANTSCLRTFRSAGEHLEDLVGVYLADPDTIVDHLDLYVVVFLDDRDLDKGFDALGIVVEFDGIVDEVFQDDAHKLFVGKINDILVDILFDLEPRWQAFLLFQYEHI